MGEPWLKGVDTPHPHCVALEVCCFQIKSLLRWVTHCCTQIQLYSLSHLRGSPTAPRLSPQRKEGLEVSSHSDSLLSTKPDLLLLFDPLLCTRLA